MKISEAAELIHVEELRGAGAQMWCDLGCGTGIFTVALAEMLAHESVIFAVDKNSSSLRRIPDEHNGVEIRKIRADFLEDKLALPKVDGALMANSLHYVRQQETFLKSICEKADRLLIVEYENRKPNFWVPYPVDFATFQKMAVSAGFRSVSKRRARRSRFGGEMYCALAER
jgi:ubiquinone/menaquinone biosynthesis C-methylase UbiE